MNDRSCHSQAEKNPTNILKKYAEACKLPFCMELNGTDQMCTETICKREERWMTRRNLQIHRLKPEYGTKTKTYMNSYGLARFIYAEVRICSYHFSSTRSLSNWNEVKFNSPERAERAESSLILYSDNLKLARTVVVLHVASIVDHLCYFCLVLCYAIVYACLLMPCVTCWERADYLALVCDI